MSLFAVKNVTIIHSLVQEDAQCLPGPRCSTLFCYWRLMWNLLRLIRNLSGQPPKSFQNLTHLEVSDISRSQSRDAEKHCCCSLQCFTAEKFSGPSPTCTQGVLPGSRSFSLSAYSASLTRLRSPPAAAFCCVACLCPPPMKCRMHTCAAEICPAGWISSHRWYLKPLAALHKTVALPGTVFVCFFV